MRFILFLQWETSVGSLNKLELHLRHCLEHFPQTEGTESYSYMCLDPSWDMIQRGGTWTGSELEIVASMHNDFVCHPSLTEVVVRWVEININLKELKTIFFLQNWIYLHFIRYYQDPHILTIPVIVIDLFLLLTAKEYVKRGRSVWYLPDSCLWKAMKHRKIGVKT